MSLGPGREPAVGEAEDMAAPPILEVRDLTTRFHTRSGTVHAVSGISYSLYPGQSLALVGESGSGKSVSALSLLGLVPHPGRIEGGEVRLRGSDLLKLSGAEWRRIRGKELAMVFQDPMQALNPSVRLGEQLAEVLTCHHADMDQAEAWQRSIEMLKRVNMPDVEDVMRRYSH